MALSPLSTYTTLPVMAEARGESRKAATLPTSWALSSFWMGALACEYLEEAVGGLTVVVLDHAHLASVMDGKGNLNPAVYQNMLCIGLSIS